MLIPLHSVWPSRPLPPPTHRGTGMRRLTFDLCQKNQVGFFFLWQMWWVNECVSGCRWVGVLAPPLGSLASRRRRRRSWRCSGSGCGLTWPFPTRRCLIGWSDWTGTLGSTNTGRNCEIFCEKESFSIYLYGGTLQYKGQTNTIKSKWLTYYNNNSISKSIYYYYVYIYIYI